MKRGNFIIMLLVLQVLVYSQGCLPQGITFSSQEQIDNFQTNYPGCIEVEGGVTIQGVDITNLLGLNTLTTIQGDFRIKDNTTLINLEGLSNLSYIGGMLYISNNSSLLNFNGLESLEAIGAKLRIGSIVFSYEWECAGNPLLEDISALQNLSSIGGNLEIYCNDNLSDLHGLGNITSIPGNLQIGRLFGPGEIFGNEGLNSLNGLQNLTSVYGTLELVGNNNLDDLTDLTNLTTISGDILITENNLLESLNGLESINSESISSLQIYNNEILSICDLPNICEFLSFSTSNNFIWNNDPNCSLTNIVLDCDVSLPCVGPIYLYSQSDIDNFQLLYQGCTEIEGDIKINGSEINSLLGLSQIIEIHGQLWIVFTENLNDLSGLNNLSYISDKLRIIGNKLTSLTGLENLSYAGNLRIGEHSIYEELGNPLLINLIGLGNLSEVGGHFSIKNNQALTSLVGLENLTKVGNGFNIAENQNIESTSGLYNLDSIGGTLGIFYNESLNDISSLSSISGNSIEGLNIRYNYNLNECAIESICDYLAAPVGIINIENNASGCNSIGEVEEACETIGAKENICQEVLTLNPNPARNKLEISTASNAEIYSLIFYTQSGQKVQTIKSPNNTIDISNLKPGLYFAEIKTNEGSVMEKIVVQ